MKNIKRNWLFIWLFLSGIACTNQLDPQLAISFENAGKNKKELLKVLRYYSSPHDSLKKKAAEFLIKNMPGLKTVETKWIDEEGNEYDAGKVLEYKDISSFRKAMDSLGVYQVIAYEKDDCSTITSEYLINNIKQAFFAWENLPYGKNLNFDQFCECILPYRVGDERLDDWRTTILNDYKEDSVFYDNLLSLEPEGIEKWYLDNWKWTFAGDSSCLRWKSRLIYEAIVTPNCKYDTRSDALTPDLNYNQMNKYGVGNCVDQAHYLSFVTRALGIVSFHDFMPTWGNTGGTHHTSVFYDKQGAVRPVFYFYDGKNLAAKMFRKTFSVQKNSIAERIDDQSQLPPFFRNNRMIDVTKEHCLVSDIEIHTGDSLAGIKYAYLSVYNLDRWQPVNWGEIKADGTAFFKDMAKEILYFPVLYNKGKYKHINAPLVINEDKLCMLDVDTNQYVQFEYQTEKNTNLNFNGNIKIYYWNKTKWEFIQEKENIDSNYIRFDNLPSNSVYRLVNTDKRYTSLYTIHDGQVKLRYFDN